MPDENIRIERDGAVATVTIDRPERRNALTAATLEELQGAFASLPETGARAAILRGAGDRAFCAGADLAEVAERGSVLDRRAYFSGVAAAVEAIARCPIPVVAAVHGFALAGGCGLAVAPDFTLAADDAQFGLPEIHVGLLPMVVMAPIFRAVGRKQAVKLVLLGERIGAREALAMGLVTEVHPKAELDARAADLARRLAALPPAMPGLAKEAMHAMADMEYFASLRYLREMVTLAASTEDSAEGIRAFLEKRKPAWSGK